MATISSLGIASGIDSNSIVSQLVALEKVPLTKLQAQATIDQAQITGFGKMQSEFSALADAAKAMVSASAWQARKASSSNPAAATITADATAAPTSFALDVDALAKAQSVASAKVSTNAAVGAGRLTIEIGKWTSTGGTPSATFAASSASALTVDIGATDTISKIAAKINAANAGVVATAFNDGSGDRLLLASKNTGAASGFRITAGTIPPDSNTASAPITDGSGLSALAFDPGAATAYGIAAAGTRIDYGQDAQARINGLPVSSATNTLTGNIPGITINLVATTTSNYVSLASPGTSNPVTMGVSQDVTGVVSKISAFVTAYNTLATDLSTSTAYDAATKTPSMFQADSSILGLQSILRSMVGSISNGSSVYKRLSDVGVQVAADGTLALDTTKLAAAANNGTELQALFTTDNKNPATNGFALKFSQFAGGAVAAGGLVKTKAAALDTQLKQNQKEQQAVTDKATALEKRLKAQYTALDARMSKLTALNSYVSQQITTWNKTSA